MKEFRLPDPGEGLVEAEIVTWRVKPGEEVKINDIVVEVETSKSLVELPIPFAGTVTALLVNEGDLVDVGTPIITVDDGEDAAASDVPTPDALGSQAFDQAHGMSGEGGRVANLVGYGPRTASAKRRPRKGAESDLTSAHDAIVSSFDPGMPVSRRADERSALSAEQSAPSGAPLPGPGVVSTEPGIASGPVLAKPPVRRLAKDLGVDLGAVVGSGDGGVISRDDVQAAADGAAQPVAVPATGQDTRIPIKGVRKVTAEAVTASAFSAPHVSEWVTCDVSATVAFLDRLRERREFRHVRLSPTLIVAKAVCLALQRTPELNSYWDGRNGEIVLKGSVNLGIAAATPRGLVVPNIKGAQAYGLRELADRLNQLVAVAKDGRTQPADMSGGSFTITNIGVFGVDGGTPILNPGEAGILCLGAIARRPWVVGSGADERIEPRWVTTVAVSFDHRLADGEQGSRFLADVAGILSDPGLALLY
ncbi:MAG: dihydrolipoamide acetyltransferase family protein [Propionibacteriaceae bacterium]